MKTDKQTFVFRLEWAQVLQQQPDSIRLAVYDAIIDYVQNGKEPAQNSAVYFAFLFIKNQIDKDAAKYEEVCAKRAEAGKKHKGNQHTNKGNKTEQMEQSEQMFQNGTNGTDNDNEYDNDNNTTINSSDIIIAEKSAKKTAKKKLDIESIIAELPITVQEIVRTWIEYKKEQHNFTYKSEKSFQMWLKDLYDKSGGNIDTMKAIVEQSIANGYKGIFELKKQNYGHTQISTERISELSDAMLEYERQIRAGVAK